MQSTTISILVNGSPTDEFKSTRGLRQRDLIEPFLVLIVAKRLAWMVRQSTKKKLYKGEKMGKNGTELSLRSSQMIFYFYMNLNT